MKLRVKQKTIDLASQDSPLSSVEPLHTMEVEIKPPYLKAWVNPMVRANFHKISIEEVSIPEGIKVKDQSKLIQIEYDGALAPQLSDLKITAKSFVFKVVCDQEQIDRTSIAKPDHAPITYKLVVQSGQSETREGALQLSFTPAKLKIKAVFEFKPEYQNGVVYKSFTEPPAVGYLKLENISDSLYTESSEITVKWDKSDGKLYFGEPTSGPYNLELKNEQQIVVLKKIPNSGDAALRIPVHLDFRKLNNPAEPINHPIRFLLEGNAEFISPSVEGSLRIQPDLTQTGLVFKLDEDGHIHNLVGVPQLPINSRYIWMPDKKEIDELELFTLEIGNQAVNAKGKYGAVKISDFKFSLTSEGAKTLTDPPLLDFLRIVELDQDNPESKTLQEFSLQHTFKDGEPTKRFKVYFKNNEIREIKDGRQKIKLKIQFQYDDGKSESRTEEDTIISFYMEKYAGDEWLALDFGTSAIVVARGGSDFRYSRAESIFEINKNLLDKGEDLEEKDKNFLSSKMILQLDGKLNSAPSDKHLVLLSPSKDKLGKEFPLLIPYLKSLIGDEYLENNDRRLDNMSYYDRDVQKIIKDQDNLLKIEQILSSAYQSLLRDFVLVEANHLPKKIIFTVPNAFNYAQYQLIRKIVEDSFSAYFAKHYITFITESNAVAYYYSVNWKKLNASNSKRTDQAAEEYVLIYDMGAGTLDVTYCYITRDERAKDFVVKIIGTIGNTTAGNYLDYILVEALLDQITDQTSRDTYQQYLRVDAGSEQRFIDGAVELKQQIATELKFALLSGKSYFNLLFFDERMNMSPLVDLQALKAHPEVQAYLQNNTTNLLENLFSLHNSINGQAKKKGEFPLDTVIFTGRGSQFPELRIALSEAISDWADPNRPIHYLKELKPEELKKIVVEGALHYTNYLINPEHKQLRSGVFARYGVLYRIEEEWHFEELLKPDPLQKDQKTWKKISTIDVRTPGKAYFVQSFAKDTAADWTKGNKAYITSLFEFVPRDASNSTQLEAFARFLVEAEIKEDDEGQLSILFRAGNRSNNPKRPVYIDKSPDSIFRKSMWPFPV